MNLKYTGILFAAAFVLSASVNASEVDGNTVGTAARGWAAQRSAWSPSCGLGTTVRQVKRHYVDVSSNVSFYAVKMLGGGTVLLSDDSDETPVLAYTTSDVDLSNIDPRSPLFGLLTRDLTATKKARAALKAKLPYTVARVRAEAVWQANRNRWSELSVAGGVAYASSPGQMDARSGVSDLRVEPLVQTQWSQENVGTAGEEWACYNYMTPDGPDFSAKAVGNTKNAPCGCVATAMAQVLKYFEYPTQHIMTDPIDALSRIKTRDCYWEKDDGTVVTNKDVSILDQPYDWENMPLTPGVDETVRPASARAAEIGAAIGHLTYNCGVAVGMMYSTDGSGAYSYDVPNALRKTFHIATAVYCQDNYDLTGNKSASVTATVDTRTNALQRMMFSNFDAGLPVIVGISGVSGGHEVVADGYGYEEGEPFVHFNMGWSGQDDLWYNIPNLEEAGFSWLQGVTYNIFTTKCSELGEPGRACFTGRCLDRKGNPLRNAKVRVYESGTENEIEGPGLTSAAGIWGIAGINAGTYDLYAESEDGTLSGCLLGVVVKAPDASQERDSRGLEFDCVIPETPEEIGNSWGNDIVLQEPRFRIGAKVFQTLEDALTVVGSGETIVVLSNATFEHSATVDVDCTIEVESGVEATNAVVSVLKGVRLCVANGARVHIKGVLFDCVDAELVTVQAGGRLAVSGALQMAKVVTSDATGFELAGAIRPVGGSLCVDCPVAQLRDQTFGTYSCDYATAEACKTNIVNAYDAELGGVPQSATGKLVWDRVADPATALAKYAEPAGGRPGESYYNSLTTLFKDCTNDATVTILRDCGKDFFKGPAVTLSKALTITGPHVISPDREAGFVIVEGGKLTLTEVTFSNYVGSCLFDVNGGELVLGDRSTLRDLKTDAKCYKATHGVTYLRAGRLVMLAGSTIYHCEACHYEGHGGGIYAENGILDLRGGSIEQCRALKAGGGVYVWNDTNGAYTAELKISGNVKIGNNLRVSEADGKSWDDNLCLATGDNPFVITGSVASAVGAIGVQYETDAGNGDSNVFARVDADLSSSERSWLCKVFTHDAEAEHAFGARVPADGKTLFWEVEPDPGQTCSESEACFAVYYDQKPDVPYYYADAETAFSCLDGDATVHIVNWTSESDWNFHFMHTLEINHRVVLVGQSGASSCGLRRHAKCPIYISETGELILTNVVVSGSYSAGGAYPLIQVDGGRLELQRGADVRSAASNGSRACGGIVVWNGGVFTMQPGSRIYNCQNNYTDVTGANRGVGGGVLIDHATAYFYGGRINGCSTATLNSGAGVYLANEAEAYLQGPLWIWGNGSPANNIVVEDNSRLYLTGPVTNKVSDTWGTGDAHIGVDPGYRTDSNLVAYVAWEGASQEDLAASAKFFHPAAGDSIKAVVGTNATLGCNVLVWSAVADPVIVVPVKSLRLSGLSFTDGKPSVQCLSDDPSAAGASLNVEVWSTEKLTDEWKLESAQTIQVGEDIELSVDSAKESKFWKIVVK